MILADTSVWIPAASCGSGFNPTGLKLSFAVGLKSDPQNTRRLLWIGLQSDIFASLRYLSQVVRVFMHAICHPATPSSTPNRMK